MDAGLFDRRSFLFADGHSHLEGEPGTMEQKIFSLYAFHICRLADPGVFYEPC